MNSRIRLCLAAIGWAFGVFGATVTWREADGSCTAALGEVAYDSAMTVQAMMEITDSTAAGDLLVLQGPGNDSTKFKSLRITYTADRDLVFQVAGKNGSTVNVGTLRSGITAGTYAVAWTVPAGGTNLAPKACAGSSIATGSNFNFDNSGTPANAPFDTWQVSDAVSALSVTLALEAANTLLQTLTAPIAYDSAMTVRAELQITDSTAAGTDLLVLKGRGNDNTKFKSLRITYTADRDLVFQVAGKDGNLKSVGTLRSGVTAGTYSVVWTVPAGGTNLTPRACAVGSGSFVSRSGFNFDNTGTPANALFASWELAPAVTALSVSSEALSEKDLLELAGSVLEIGAAGFEWPAGRTEATVRFTSTAGVLTIPAGCTVTRLTFADDTLGGRIDLSGTFAGADTPEPGLPAFAIPASVSLHLKSGAVLEMDGRISAPVVIDSGVQLGAASPTRTLTLDAVTLAADAALPEVTQGCVEIYEAYRFQLAPKTAESQPALRRWKLPGYHILLK